MKPVRRVGPAWMPCLVFLLLPLCAAADQKAVSAAVTPPPVTVMPYASAQFNLGAAAPFEFDLKLEQAADMAVSIATSDRDQVQQLASMRHYEAGLHHFVWNGRDKTGQPVPDEVYFPDLELKTAQGLVRMHPADTSGGEVIEPKVTLQQAGDIQFKLDRPARVLVRAGIKSGPLMRSLAVWDPYPAGNNRISWDGYDESHRYRLIEDSRFAVMVTGFALPEHPIFAYGSSTGSYAAWRKKMGWTVASADHAVTVKEERDGKALSRAFFSPQYQPYDPKVIFSWLNQKQAEPALSGAALVKVDIPPADRAVLESNLFEVGFFVDGAFVSEEEQGYVPFTWRFEANQFAAGKHVLTVNISGFTGQVGSASLLFTVAPKK